MSCSRSGLGKPRSRKTFPLPCFTSILFCFFISVLPFPVIAFRRRETLPDQLDYHLRRCDAFLRLLLKGMQDINRILETNRIYRPVSCSRHLVRQFPKTVRPAKPFSALTDEYSLPHCAAYKACHTRRCTARGKLLRSLLEDPTHQTGRGSTSIILVYVFPYLKVRPLLIQHHRPWIPKFKLNYYRKMQEHCAR